MKILDKNHIRFYQVTKIILCNMISTYCNPARGYAYETADAVMVFLHL